MDSSYLQQKIYEAYRKLKNYYYYDNTSLFTRIRLAEYENDIYKLDRAKFKKVFADKTSDLLDIIESRDKDDEKLNALLAKIDFKILPKSMKEIDQKEDLKVTYISNNRSKDTLEVDDYNIVIDAPIDVHLISTLWIMFVGIHLSKLTKANNYAYIFSINHSDYGSKEYLPSGLQLYTPYYKGYQDWRDNALRKAESILNNHKNATIVSLDIKRYFYNVRIDVVKFVEKLFEDHNIRLLENEKRLVKRLTVLLGKIHFVYSTKINDYLPEDMKLPLTDETLLPIGLISSGLLGNLYLKDFDDLVINKLNPDYYGRYVDDMLFVIGDTYISDDINSFLNTCFVDRGILKIDENDDNNFSLLGNPNYHLVIQKNKVIVEDFIHYESKAALMKFIRNIQRQRSEFRFLPDEEGVEKDFDEAAFSMQYSGSVNKLRNIKDFRQDKYGASLLSR